VPPQAKFACNRLTSEQLNKRRQLVLTLADAPKTFQFTIYMLPRSLQNRSDLQRSPQFGKQQQTILACSSRQASSSQRETDATPTRALKQLFSGGIAGSLAKTVTAPFSRLVILFQVHSLTSTKGSAAPLFASGAIDGAKKVIEREGFLAFWKGNGTSVLHRFPYSAINFYVYEKASAFLNNFVNRKKSSNSFLNDHGLFISRFGAGAFAGTSAVLCCYPLDLIRTRLTTDLTHIGHYTGITDALKKIVLNEGFLGLYSGLTATLLVAVPSFAISYGVYGSLKEEALESDRFINFRVQDPKTETPRLGFLISLGIGSVSGSLSAVVTYPIDVIRRRMQIQALHLDTIEDKNLRQHVRYIYSHEGLRGFYRGLGIELCKVVPMVGVMFSIYEYSRQVLSIN